MKREEQAEEKHLISPSALLGGRKAQEHCGDEQR